LTAVFTTITHLPKSYPGDLQTDDYHFTSVTAFQNSVLASYLTFCLS